ncbi:NYN domain-containing protein [Saccharomonospora azurea]|uniref:NYN domain-containing protein n=1 Tax=Saccharomonospora azurea TaxID=40988 RepID=UPI002409182C|nr:NYN domain-containing protein [Saccharomonospora azurea]
MLSSSAYPEHPEDSSSGTPSEEGGAAASRQAHAEEDGAVTEPVDWLGLPEPIRERVAELAAAALGRLPSDDVPRQLRPVARFAPAKRARLGGPALLAALRDSTRFRTAVLEWLREHRVDALNPNDGDSVAAAAAAVLLNESSASSRVRLVARNTEESTLRAERDAALARVRKLESEVERLRADLEQAREEVEQARAEREDEIVKLRGRLREQGVRVRQAKDEAAEAVAARERAEAERDSEIEAITARYERERQKAAAERARAERALVEAEVARQSAREARDADEVRLSMLLDTLSGAVDGLRRELSVAGSPRRPADTVRGANAGRRGGRVSEPRTLDTLLSLPGVHLIVDGYNITKTGYPDLSLAEQRQRLVRQLGALAARTGAEVTVVFDGADVTAVPAAGPRSVRVLFSDPGVLADDVIRTIVRSEPQGRPLVVATSDQAVVTSVCSEGAHAVPAAVLLTRLGRV